MCETGRRPSKTTGRFAEVARVLRLRADDRRLLAIARRFYDAAAEAFMAAATGRWPTKSNISGRFARLPTMRSRRRSGRSGLTGRRRAPARLISHSLSSHAEQRLRLSLDAADADGIDADDIDADDRDANDINATEPVGNESSSIDDAAAAELFRLGAIRRTSVAETKVNDRLAKRIEHHRSRWRHSASVHATCGRNQR
uniref:Uncharacterized protein n=1 Tax=Plectus sambesii TaxID=2011161 RepID=A0A914V3J7_9BILA